MRLPSSLFLSVCPACLCLSGCSEENTAEPSAPRPARIAVVTPHKLTLVAQGAGRIGSRYVSQVGFEVGGRVVSRDVDVGAIVKRGQKLAELSAIDFHNKVTAADADLSTAKAALTQAAAQEQRFRILLKKGFATHSQYDDALKSLHSAQAAVQATEANLRIAQNQLGYTQLAAPDDGIVTATGADPGQVVAAGQMVVEISRNDGREAVFAVASDDIPRAKLGMAVNVSLQGRSDIATTGTIREISPEADRTTGTYQVKVALPSTRAEMRLGSVVVGRVETEGKEVRPSCRRAAAIRRLSAGLGGRQERQGRAPQDPARRIRWRLGRGEPRIVGRGEGGDCRGQLARRRRAREARDGGQVMTRFNLSEWAVHNRALVVFLMLICVIGGVSAYERLGRQEDPDFTVKTMVVQAVWPGATATDTLKQVTDRLEKKLEETPNLDYIKSYTKPGQATIFVYLKELTPKSALNDIRYQVRKKVSDIRATLPQGVVGPFFNDEFGDIFGIIYGITFDGLPRARHATSPRPRGPSSCAHQMSARSRSTATKTRRSI